MNGRASFLPVAALVLGISGLVGPRPLSAHFPQQSVLVGRVEVREAAPGWVGVEFRKLVVADTARVMISSVFPGSPADRAGLRSGDRVLKVNGTFVTFAIMESVGPRIEPGDPYTFTVLRAGEVLEIPLTAEKRPESSEIIVTRMQTQLDTLRKLIGVALDSLEVSDYSGLPVLEVRPLEQLDGSVTFTVSTAEGTFTMSDAQVRAGDLDWADADHFQAAWIVQDSVRVLPRVPLAPSPRTTPRTSDVYRRIEAGTRAAPEGRSSGEGWAISGSLSPWTEGARRVAGAEMHPVGADLGRYLGVGRGLLIVDVTPGTPAARSGLLPGDVLLTADGTSIESLADLREVLAIPAKANVLEVHRQGRVMEFDLRR